MVRKRIAFVWFGISGRYGVWRDGLWRAMKHIEEIHDVGYFEPSGNIELFNPDIILFWEAPYTSQGKDKDMWSRIINIPYRKALLFAGGPVKKEWVDKFDHVFVESKINKEEFDSLGIPNSTAFGINEEIMKPVDLPKKYIGIHHGTCASWKRQWLVGESLGKDGLVVGRYQESDRFPFDECKRLGTVVMDEQSPEKIAELLNESRICLQTSRADGGGQRCTLEAMACNIPVICMSDSPKNREYVEDSGFGVVTAPDAPHIKIEIESVLKREWGTKGREYILSKWTSRHYADNLLIWINKQ